MKYSGLGYPDEQPKMANQAKKVKCWRNNKAQHFVPKRPLSKILYFEKYGNRC